MRIRLAREAVPTNDGRLLAGGSLYWGSNPIPVTYARQVNSRRTETTLCGTVRDVRREDDGWVTGWLWTHTGFDPAGLSPEVDLDKAEGPDDEPVFVRARLAAVHLGHRPCWDGLVIGLEEGQ